MIPEEKQEVLKELSQMASQFAEKHGIEIFMATSITEKGEENTQQTTGLILSGKPENIIMSLAGSVRSDPRVGYILVRAVDRAATTEFSEFKVTPEHW